MQVTFLSSYPVQVRISLYNVFFANTPGNAIFSMFNHNKYLTTDTDREKNIMLDYNMMRSIAQIILSAIQDCRETTGWFPL